jgi:hypothetical protein
MDEVDYVGKSDGYKMDAEDYSRLNKELRKASQWIIGDCAMNSVYCKRLYW